MREVHLMAANGYTALAYITTTGKVIYEVDLVEDPSWDARINDAGSWQVKAKYGHRPGSRDQVREWCTPGMCSVAIVLGDSLVCQAGPITSYTPGETDTAVTVSGMGLWEAFNIRLLHNQAWNPATTRITDPSANILATDSLWNIARTIASHSTSWANRPGSALPLDLPTADPAGGTEVRQYFGYDQAMAGQRLQELTQDDNGPDIYFQPYLTTSGGTRVIRHRMLIGKPRLTQPGVPLLFDYNGNLVRLSINGGIGSVATTVWTKGSGTQNGQMYGYATAGALLDAGYPAIDLIDSSHSSATSQPALDGWAAAGISLFGNAQVEQWKATVKTDRDPRWGEYLPGHYANYSVQDHPWLPNGFYLFRILGVSYSPSNQRGTVDHLVQAVRM